MTPPRERVTSRRNALLRFLLLVAILVAAFFLFRDSQLIEYLTLDRLTSVIEKIRATWWSPLALIGLWTVLSPLAFPASPLVAAGAVVFGTWWGTLYNSLGAVLGAGTAFLFARFLGRDFIVHLLGEERISKIEHRLDHYGFTAMIFVRFIPVPFPAVNIGAALVGFRLVPFLTSTAIGVTPVIFVYGLFFASLVGATVEQGRERMLQFAGALAVLALIGVLRVFLRKRVEPAPSSDTGTGETAGDSPG